jgi:hypothetical protein
MRGQRAGSGRQRAGRAGAPVMPRECSCSSTSDPEESRTCGIHCTCTLGTIVYRIQSTPRFFRKRSGQMANRSRTALIYFSRAHTTEVSPSAGGISFRRKRITNGRGGGGQAHRLTLVMDVIVYPARLSKANTWIYRAATSHPRVGHPTRRDNPVLALGHLDPLGCHRGAWMAQHPG